MMRTQGRRLTSRTRTATSIMPCAILEPPRRACVAEPRLSQTIERVQGALSPRVRARPRVRGAALPRARTAGATATGQPPPAALRWAHSDETGRSRRAAQSPTAQTQHASVLSLKRCWRAKRSTPLASNTHTAERRENAVCVSLVRASGAEPRPPTLPRRLAPLPPSRAVCRSARTAVPSAPTVTTPVVPVGGRSRGTLTSHRTCSRIPPYL